MHAPKPLHSGCDGIPQASDPRGGLWRGELPCPGDAARGGCRDPGRGHVGREDCHCVHRSEPGEGIPSYDDAHVMHGKL